MEIRAGLHTGEIESNGDDIAGLAVAIGARVETWRRPARCSSPPPSRISSWARVSSSRIGIHTLKGVPDSWHLHALAVAAAEQAPAAVA